MPRSQLQFQQHAYVWKDAFAQMDRHSHYYESENLRKAQQPQYSAKDGVRVLELLSPYPITRDVIDRFVHNDCQQNIGRYLYRQLLQHFLEKVTMETLEQPYGSPSFYSPNIMRKSALIDDRRRGSVTMPSGDARQFLGPLNAHQFYSELLKNRIGLKDTPDAERRLIYITDIEPLYILALAATVPPSQTSFLRDFSYSHLAFETSLRVHIPAFIRSTFSLEFHLPYYAWRRVYSNQCTRKDRRDLRPSDEVIKFKRPKKSPSSNRGLFKDYIHHVQVSVMITGLDDRFWTSYCFVDLYFEDDDHIEQVYCLSKQSHGRVPMDPNSCGLDSMDRPKWNPRHYFLRSLSCRMSQVRQEWKCCISQLRKEIDPCIDAFIERQDGNDTHDNSMKFIHQAEFNWSRRILRQFTDLITKSINVWETFKNGEIHYFDLPDSEAATRASWGALMADIDSNVEELKKLRDELLYCTELFETMTTNILTHATHQESMTTKLQSRFLQALTVITIAYLPPSLASAVFSMQSPVISNPQFKHWAYTVAGLFIATGFLIFALSIPSFVDLRKVSRYLRTSIVYIFSRAWSWTVSKVSRWKNERKDRSDRRSSGGSVGSGGEETQLASVRSVSVGATSVRGFA